MSLNVLLICLPIAIVLDWYNASPIAVFFVSILAIIPLAGFMGRATEQLSNYVGATIGGLLSASLGNAPELIISGFALKEGLVDVVKASITGSILGNTLFSLGLSMIAGGWGRQDQNFNRTIASMSGGLMFVASIGLLIPAMFHFASSQERTVSLEVSLILLVVYLLSLMFTLKAHHLIQPEPVSRDELPEQITKEQWSKGRAVGTLTAVIVAIAVMSEILVEVVE